MPTQGSPASPTSRSFIAGLFLVTAATLALEVLLTRLLSVLTWYSLAFLVIAMGLFGITAGAVLTYLRPPPDSQSSWRRRLAKDALLFAWLVPASYVLLLLIPLRLAPEATTVVLFVVFSAVLAAPFVAAGAVVAAALTQSPWPVGRVYAIDLLGAATGAAVVPLVLARLDAGAAIAVVAVAPALAAVAFAHGSGERALVRQGLVAACVCGAVALFNSTSRHGLVPLWVKGKPEDRALVAAEFWNSHSRVQLSRSVELPGALWGAGTRCQPPVVTQRIMVIDGDAATPLYPVQSNLEELRFLDCDVTNLVHHVRPHGSIAIIGVGGSRDIQSALLFGHRPVVGLEFNEILLGILRGPVGRTTTVPDHPDVRLVHAEARSYLATTPERFRVIQASLIDTWAATGAGAHALGENGLYTVEAWTLFLRRLEQDGVLSVSRWASGESARLIPLATAALLELGVARARDHVIVAQAGKVSTMLVSRSPWTAEDIGRARAAADEKGFQILVAPDLPAGPATFAGWLDARNVAELESRTLLPTLDFRPPTDDRPFFFNVVRARAFWEPVPAGAAGSIQGNQTATSALALAFLASLVLSAVAVVLPLAYKARPEKRVTSGLMAALGYFALIGIGFMLCEMALLQRLSLVLGHPSYSLMVVLASVVGAAGLGSLASDRLAIDRKPACYVFCTTAASLLAALAWGLPWLAERLQTASMGVRVSASAALCALVGFVLGMAFPAGMRMVRATHQQEAPWLWGINGVGSVLASSAAVLIALSWGLRWLFLAAGMCYALLIPLVAVMRWEREGNEPAT